MKRSPQNSFRQKVQVEKVPSVGQMEMKIGILESLSNCLSNEKENNDNEKPKQQQQNSRKSKTQTKGEKSSFDQNQFFNAFCHSNDHETE